MLTENYDAKKDLECERESPSHRIRVQEVKSEV